MHFPRSRRLLAVIPLLALVTLTACGDDDAPSADALSQVTVSGGTDKEAPKVTLKPSPLSVDETTTRVLKGGSGAELEEDSIAQVRFVLLNGKDGKQLTSTWGQQDFGFAMDSEGLIPGLGKGLIGQKVGARVLLGLPPDDAFGSQGQPDLGVGPEDTVVMLVDVLSEVEPLATATGTAVAPKAGLPTVKVTDPATTASVITVPQANPPTTTVIQPLITGTGPKVAQGQSVRVLYTGALWKDGKVFDSSATSERKYFDTPIGTQNVIKAWDNALVGATVGSRLLLVVPPADGYGSAGRPPTIAGTDTLVFVIDVLAAF